MPVAPALTYPSKRLLTKFDDTALKARLFLVNKKLIALKLLANSETKYFLTLLFYSSTIRTTKFDNTALKARLFLVNKKRISVAKLIIEIMKAFPVAYLKKDPDLLNLTGQRWPTKG